MEINTKIIGGTILGVILFLFILIWLTLIDWLTSTQLLFSILTIVVLGGLIILMYFLLRRPGAITDLHDKLNSTTMVVWVKKYIRDSYHDEIEIDEKRYLYVPSRNKEGESHIGYISCIGLSSNEKYHILLDLKDPEGVHSVLKGKYTIDDIYREAQNLSATSYKPKRRTTRYAQDDPSRIETQIDEDLTPPDIEEELIENEKTKDKKTR